MLCMRKSYALFALVGVSLVGGACGSSAAGYGKAGTLASSSRTVVVHILASHRYDPSALGVNPGETVTFKVVNDDTNLHEFVLGDQKAQDAHEKEMAGMGMANMKMADTANRIDLAGGETKQLAWTFPSDKGVTVIYGSHVPGDYASGLKGAITVGTASSGSSATTVAGYGSTATTMGGMGSTATTMGGMGDTATTMGGMGSTATTMGGMGSTATTMGGMEGTTIPKGATTTVMP